MGAWGLGDVMEERDHQRLEELERELEELKRKNEQLRAELILSRSGLPQLGWLGLRICLCAPGEAGAIQPVKVRFGKGVAPAR
jgi:hypothetical protein